jgi:hypothetical protein
VDYGVTTLDELRERLTAARRAWVRALVGPAGDEPAALLSLQAIVGLRPPAWRKQTWMYPQCTFASAQISSARLASLCEPGPLSADTQFDDGGVVDVEDVGAGKSPAGGVPAGLWCAWWRLGGQSAVTSAAAARAADSSTMALRLA